MDDGADAELQRLRARAYGPGADIREDGLALQRLSELEDLRRAGANRPAHDPDHGLPSGAGPSTGTDIIRPAPSQDPSKTAVMAPPSARRHRRLRARWVAVIWAASLIAVALVAGAVALSAAPPPAPLAGGGQHIATLRAVPDFGWPQFLGEERSDSLGFEDFYGLRPVSARGMSAAESTDACMVLIPAAQILPDSSSFQGRMFTGCAAGPFPATIQIIVRGELPPQLLERFPEETALQFVLDGSRIHVYAADSQRGE